MVERLTLLVAIGALAGGVAAAGAAGGAEVALVGVTFRGFDRPLLLQHFTPRTLSPEGSTLSLGIRGNEGWRWARRGRMLAVEVYTPGMTRRSAPVALVDAGRLRVVARAPVGRRDVCALGFDGPTLVVLTARPWCYARRSTKTRFSLLRIDPAHGRLERELSVGPLRPLVYPVGLAFGDGYAFVSRAGGAVDTVDLHSGTVARHRPLRALAKGNERVDAHWLGRHQLGVGGRLVDVRTWRSRVLDPTARAIVPAGRSLLVFGGDGASVFGRSGHLRFRLLRGEAIQDAQVAGGRLYATYGVGTEVVDLTTRRLVAVVPHANEWTLLAP